MPRRLSPYLLPVLIAATLSACAEEYGQVAAGGQPGSSDAAAPSSGVVAESPVQSATELTPSPAAIAPVLDGPDALSTVIAAVARGGLPATGAERAPGPLANASATAQRLERETTLRGAQGGATAATATTRAPLVPTERSAALSPSWTPPAAEPTMVRPVATVPATPTANPFALAGAPVRFEAPSIGVDAYVEHVGLTSDRAMDTPKGWMNVAWYQEGFYPGEAGNAVIAGHLDSSSGGPAVFWDLDDLRPGDEVSVTYENGDRYTFMVQGSETYPFDADGPMVRSIFGSSMTSDLNLITCDGAWQQGQATYSHRLVVFTTLQPDRTVRGGADQHAD